ncbi:hypothetical protein [Lysobacter enzymogenes]|nr:hypothetical protein [Lysobacter enzymogenes]QQP98372.1 hypothetical protein JHW38_10500 [Lysobacter enzymogenes]
MHRIDCAAPPPMRQCIDAPSIAIANPRANEADHAIGGGTDATMRELSA